MGQSRYTVDSEDVDKWLIEEVVDGALDLDTKPVKVTVTDNKTGEEESAVSSDYDEALEKACKKLGISTGDLGDEYDDDEDDDED
jgi:ribosome-binding protein aMBF1 (putative translation factor)